MSSKPSLVLVHGFCGGATHWAEVIPILARKGYDLHAVENPMTSLADDAERTRKKVTAQKGPVLLVGHSLRRCDCHAGGPPAECRGAGVLRGVRAGCRRKRRQCGVPRAGAG